MNKINFSKTDNNIFISCLDQNIKENNLSLINKVLESQIKARKPNVDTIYYVSEDLDGSSAFLSLGFHLKNEKQVKKNIVTKEDVV